jgi:hypothetical protein
MGVQSGVLTCGAALAARWIPACAGMSVGWVGVAFRATPSRSWGWVAVAFEPTLPLEGEGEAGR